MGILRSDTNHSGLVVGKLTLGEPAQQDDGTLVWCDPRLPNGVINPDGTLTLDDEDI